MIADKEKSREAATAIVKWASSEHFETKLLSPTVFEDVLRNGGGIYSALAGPGVGKTKERLAGCLHAHVHMGHFCMCVSSLRKVRNAHVAMLLHVMGETLFRLRVRVIGSADLEPLAASCTLDALVKMRDATSRGGA